MGDDVGKWVVLAGYAIVLVVLVRPGSLGPSFITSVGGAMTSLMSASTGGGTW